MALRAMVSGLQLLVPFLAVLFLVSGRVNAQVTCQTSGASPNAIDAMACAKYLISLGNDQCCQTNCASADACTTLIGGGTAASAICGNCGNCVTCQEAGNYLASIIENCEANGLVGGYIFGFANPTVNVNVFHS